MISFTTPHWKCDAPQLALLDEPERSPADGIVKQGDLRELEDLDKGTKTSLFHQLTAKENAGQVLLNSGEDPAALGFELHSSSRKSWQVDRPWRHPPASLAGASSTCLVRHHTMLQLVFVPFYVLSCLLVVLRAYFQHLHRHVLALHIHQHHIHITSGCPWQVDGPWCLRKCMLLYRFDVENTRILRFSSSDCDN